VSDKKESLDPRHTEIKGRGSFLQGQKTRPIYKEIRNQIKKDKMAGIKIRYRCDSIPYSVFFEFRGRF
jgi:hypothetical protein